MKRLLLFILVCGFILRFPLITGCANIIPPSGGPRDSLPPVLVDASPAERSLKVTPKKIVLNFDEFIELKDPRQNIIFSPVPKVTPTVTSHLRTITIEIRDTLEPNTTYAIDFGKTIADVNESNILRNFTYVFSTGTNLDSMTYGGRVIMANTGKPDSTLIVMLHTQLDDSAVAKTKPRYITRLDSSGNFTFRNLRPGVYALYALEDQSGTHEYTSKFQAFAFADSPVDLRKQEAPLILYAFADTSQAGKKPTKTAPPPAPKKEDKDKPKRLIIMSNVSGGQLDLHQQLELAFQNPLTHYDSSKIQLVTDSFQTVSGYRLAMDSTGKRITVHYTWPQDTRFRLILQKDFGQDSLENKLLKTDTITFSTKKETDYGILRLRFRNVDLSRNPVIFFMQGGKTYLSAPMSRNLRYSNKLFDPGEYEINILYDLNHNGVWDPGDFYKHLQPEIVVPVKKKLTVRADWENEVDVVLEAP
jgi:hypothetical protein